MFFVMQLDTYLDERLGIRIAYRPEGQLLKSPAHAAQMPITTNNVHDLLFAEDYGLNTATKEGMQLSMDLFTTVPTPD
ncbi:unnamed protein product [Schistocephalus solidus]|uniref:Reverse transcriptase domain-containing protein n=1 Tax=Schistocephalus solidus TaxID=70667 RepID=A0A183TRE4_SCHSO|nr:unnamed protein product [Schistocephalus solidus]